jgi:F0F1-type ATP synthase assembly protein I
VIDRRIARRLAGASALVLEMALTVVAGVFAGGWLDGRFGTGPAFLITLSIGALVLGMWRLTTTLDRLLDPDERLPPDPDA